MPDQPLYTHGQYSVIRHADNRLVILDGDGYTLPDAPCTLAEAQAFIADYCRCRVCEGEGWATCDTCKGDGRIIERWEDNLLHVRSCPDCEGIGYAKCRRCGGKGEEL